MDNESIFQPVFDTGACTVRVWREFEENICPCNLTFRIFQNKSLGFRDIVGDSFLRLVSYASNLFDPQNCL
jgi:hypothetical protein